MKKCPVCKTEKPLDAFYVQRKTKDGRHPYCKECSRAMAKASYKIRGKKSWVSDKICKWCQVLKPKTEFPKGPDGRIGYRCLACEAEIAAHETQGHRRCNICREWLDKTAFYPSQLRFPNIACVVCSRTQMTKPEYQLRRRNFTLLKEYGITLEQYKELLEKQNYACPVCLESFERGNFSYPLDHSHGGKFAGRIRAILHQDCNRFVMWMHEDSAQLRRAADLIDNPLTDWIVPKPTLNERRREKERKT